jgi:hypothetical protein
MTRALTALFDPGPLIRAAQRNEKPAPVTGLALMLEGRLLDYRAIAGRVGWPVLGEAARTRAAAETRLLGAIGLHLTGSDQAESEYRSLIRAKDLDAATLALLLLSFLYSDTGRPNAAIELLSKNAGKFSRSPIPGALIFLQRGMRLAEAGLLDDAVEETRRVKSLIRGSKPASWGKALGTIAEHNLFAYQWRIRPGATLPTNLPLMSNQPTLLRDTLLIEEGTSKFLDATFERGLADPYSRSVLFQAADPVEVPLHGAVIRTELLSDWNAARRARTLLGRYLTISRLGTPNGVPTGAFELLRRSGDAKGIQSAARTISRVGPLGPLRLFVSSLIDRSPFADEPAASLAVLLEAAHLLSPEEAARAATELMGEESTFINQWNTSSRALAELIRTAPSSFQTEAASFTRRLLESTVHSGVVQELSRVVQAIRWAEVDEDERKRWTPIVRETYGAKTDARFAAASAVIALADIDPTMVEGLLHDRLAHSPAVDVVSVLFSVLDPPPRWARQQAWPVIASSLLEIRESAARGSHALGGIDVARLAVEVLRHQPRDKPGWDLLIDFLVDPKVDASSKAGALDDLGRPRTRIPRSVEARLRDAIDAVGAVDVPLGTSPEALEATKLRLALRIGGLASEVILARLLALAGNANVLSRVMAARTVAFGSTRLGHEVSLTIALTLSHDAEPDVRGAAGTALAQMAGDAGGSLAQARRARIRNLLAESGVVAPLGVLAGLYGVRELGRPIEPDVEKLVRSIEQHHASRRVRDAAQRVLSLNSDRDERSAS